MKNYFAYIRVSDPRQGKGVSLGEQEIAIRNHAAQQQIEIVEWFREKETAAAKGRRMFSDMLTRLEYGEAEGVIIHKIDRGARNLEDWSNLGRLFDLGIDVQFAHDRIDLKTRGGRLSADIIAVVAADYIRNLREEVRKGFYGRLKQGFYPLPAPIGYLDHGAGMAKTIDPATGPLIKQAFERYAKGMLGIRELRKELSDSGLRSRRGGYMTVSGLAKLLSNPFYMGLVHITATGETFQGNHEPLISKSLFDRVQLVLAGKAIRGANQHEHLFRGYLRCGVCDRLLTGEIQKGRYIYYRCHNDDCHGICLRQEAVEAEFKALLHGVTLGEREIRALGDLVDLQEKAMSSSRAANADSIRLQIRSTEAQLSHLTDALVDRWIEKDEHDVRKRSALEKLAQLKEQEACEHSHSLTKAFKKFELQNTLILGYETAEPDKQLEIRNLVSSNCIVAGKKLAFTLHSPYREMLDDPNPGYGGPYKYAIRTRMAQVLDILKAQAHLPANDNEPAEQQAA